MRDGFFSPAAPDGATTTAIAAVAAASYVAVLLLVLLPYWCCCEWIIAPMTRSCLLVGVLLHPGMEAALFPWDNVETHQDTVVWRVKGRKGGA